MREVQATEADWSGLLDEVEKGGTVVITREGRAVARMVPESKPARSRADVFRDIEAFRETMRGKVTLEEILAWRHEGPSIENHGRLIQRQPQPHVIEFVPEGLEYDLKK